MPESSAARHPEGCKCAYCMAEKFPTLHAPLPGHPDPNMTTFCCCRACLGLEAPAEPPTVILQATVAPPRVIYGVLPLSAYTQRREQYDDLVGAIKHGD